MKKLISILAFAVLFLVSGKALKAQFKMAYLYSDSLIVLMPETKEADSAIAKVQKAYEDAYKKKEADYVAKTKEAQEMIDANKGQQPNDDPKFLLLISDITDLEKKLGELQQTAQTQINKKRQEVYEPIIKKAKDAIAKVAKAKGYSYVLDASIGTFLYSQPSDNIIEDVKKELGIK